MPAVVEDQITTFLEMESHQISSLQMEVQRLREDLRQEKADKAALKDEVIWLKLYIVDHCLKEKRGQCKRITVISLIKSTYVLLFHFLFY